METVKLGLLIKKTKVARCGEHSYPVLSITKQDGIIMQSEKFKKRIASADTSDYKIIPRGKLVQGIHIDEGNFGIQDIVDNGIVSPAYGVWDVNDGLVIPKYLEMVLRSPKSIEFYRSKLTGTVNRRGHMSDADFLSMDIPLPDRDTQSKILKTMKQTTSVLYSRQQQLAKLDELIKARFVEMFGDLVENPKQFPCVLLGSIMTVMPQNGLYKPQSAYVQDKFGTPILRIDGFYNGKVTDFNNLKRLCCTDFEKERYLLVENDIVINRVNSIEYLGKCARISGLQEDTVFESNMMRFHLDDSKVNSTYITTVLCSQYIYRQILTRAKKAVNQASINQGDVQSLNVVVPPLSLQNQFADFVAEVDKSKVEVQKALDQTQLLFDSLMQQYFG